jgi:hypothetical protein
VPHDHYMVHLGAVLAEHLFEPLELLAGHPGRDLTLLALALLEHVHRHEQGVLVEPVEGGPLHVVGPVERHAQMTLEGILVKRHGGGHGTPPGIVGHLMVAEGGVDLQIVVLEALDPARVIFFRPLVDLLLLRSPVPHDEVARHQGEGRVFLFHGIEDETEGILPSLLRVLDVEVQEVGYADESPGSRINRIGLGHQGTGGKEAQG